MVRALRQIIGLIEHISVSVGRAGSLILPILMVVIVLNVVLRYGFGIGLVELEEVQWHLNAFVVLACLAFTYRDNAHVRVDVLHSAYSKRRKAQVEILGVTLLLLPFVIGICWFAWGNFTYSLSIGERSAMPSGLPARYVVKFAMFAGFLLLGFQGVAVLLRQILILARRHDEPPESPPR